MKGSEVIALAYHILHLVVDDDALGELFGAVNHTVSDGVDFAIALYATFIGVGEHVEDGLDCTFMVGFAEFEDSLGAVGTLIFQESVGKTDFFHSTFGHRGFGSGVDEFVFYRAAARVDYKYFHCGIIYWPLRR